MPHINTLSLPAIILMLKSVYSSTPMKTVAYDRQIFIEQSYGGISRYFSSLYSSLTHSTHITPKLLFRFHKNSYIYEESAAGSLLHPYIARIYAQTLAPTSDKVHLRLESFDVMHSTQYRGAPPFSGRSFAHVATLYDMAPEMLPEYFPNRNPHHNKLEWLEAADSIISISQSSADDLAFISPHLSSKISVIPLCSFIANPSSTPYNESPPFNYAPYLLYVGPRYGYKNFSSLISSYSQAFSGCTDSPHVICAGSKTFSKSELKALDQAGIRQKFVHIIPTDLQLTTLYKYASAVVIPSLFEGFSLPLVEALRHDVPILCSDIPVHREVASTFASIERVNSQSWISAFAAYSSLAKPSQILGSQYDHLNHYYSTTRMSQAHEALYGQL